MEKETILTQMSNVHMQRRSVCIRLRPFWLMEDQDISHRPTLHPELKIQLNTRTVSSPLWMARTITIGDLEVAGAVHA